MLLFDLFFCSFYWKALLFIAKHENNDFLLLAALGCWWKSCCRKMSQVLANFNDFNVFGVWNVPFWWDLTGFNSVCGILIFNENGPPKRHPKSAKSSFQKWCYFVRPDANYSFFGVSNRPFFNQNRLFYSVCGPCKIKLFVYFFSNPFCSKTVIPKSVLKQAKIVKNAIVRSLFL